MPSLRRNVVEPIHSVKTGSRKLRHWKDLEKTQYFPEEALLGLQWERLKSIIEHSYRRNRFYRRWFREAGLVPSDIRTRKDMLHLPVLTKEQIRRNVAEMISEGFRLQDLLKFKTGGSTGKALEIYITEECSETRNACARRHDRWSGWEVGEPIGAVWGNIKVPAALKEKLKGLLLAPVIYLDTMQINQQTVTEFGESWKKKKPSLLFGHAHSLFLLASYVGRLNIDSIRPKAIISTSMMLLSHEREVIERTFRTPVFDRYGCEEVGLISSECERHEGMHINIEHLFVEFLDPLGGPAAPGTPARIVVTDLVNRAMPLIRYQVEDMGVSLGRKCSCGRGLPLMEKVTGRIADFLIKRDGTRVAGVSLIEQTLTRIPGIDQMQIIQESIDTIVANTVVSPLFTESRETELKEYFLRFFGKETNVLLRYVPEILPEKSGKFRFAICRIDATRRIGGGKE
jgi:phenylacetate-CoA ligase